MVKHRHLQQQVIKQQLAGLQSDLPQHSASAVQLRNKATRTLLFSSILLASSVAAGSESGDGFERQLGSHQHGEAHLDVVLSDSQMLISFTSPAANIVGFEHEPRNSEQEQQVAAARKHLLDLSAWLTIPAAAGCELTAAELVESATDHDEQGHDEHEQHDEHDHDKHDHDEHDEHAGHDEHDHGEETHSDWQLEYQLSCKNVAQLSHFDVELFGQYPALEEIRVQAVGPSQQSLQELTPEQIRFRF